MLKGAIIFLVLALVMAVLAFCGLAGVFVDIAQILVWPAAIVAASLFALGYCVARKVRGLTSDYGE